MRIEFDTGNIRLTGGRMLKIRDGLGRTVCCRSGALWLTEEDRARDVQLGPGACHRLSVRGLAIVQAVDDAELSLA